MYLTYGRENGEMVTLVARQATEDRLQTTCFRGTELCLAGNFFRWSNLEQVVLDRFVLKTLLKTIETTIQDEHRVNSLTVSCPIPVGWTSTDRVAAYHSGDMERFKPSRRSRALRIRKDRQGIVAPQTNKLTLVYELRRERRGPVVVIHSVYPGPDIGELDGDLTAREGVVFFDWNHPGA